jgi:hypothetical protein
LLLLPSAVRSKAHTAVTYTPFSPPPPPFNSASRPEAVCEAAVYLLTTLQMYVLNGRAACQLLCEHPLFKKTPFSKMPLSSCHGFSSVQASYANVWVQQLQSY